MPMTGNIDRVEVITSVQRRRRWSAEEKAQIVQETYAPGMSVSLVARQHGVAPNQVFKWRQLYAEGALSAVGAGEEVVPASEYRALQHQVRELQRLLGKNTLEDEVLRDALELAQPKKLGWQSWLSEDCSGRAGMLREVWNGAAIGSNASGLRTHFTAAAARMPELSAADAHTLREPSHARDVIGRGTALIKDPPLRTGGLPASSHPLPARGGRGDCAAPARVRAGRDRAGRRLASPRAP